MRQALVLLVVVSLVLSAALADIAPGPKPPVPAPSTSPSPSPSATPAATTAPEQKSSWYSATVGDTLVYKMQNNMQQTWKVTKVDDKIVTVEMSTVLNGNPVGTSNMTQPRMVPAPKGPVALAPGNEMKELADEVVKVSGQDLTCKVRQVMIKVGDRVITSKSWMCDKVPGGIVKSESDALGANAVTIELTEFKKGS